MLLHKQRGVAAVEMGLVVIPMLLISFGITELGRAIYQYNGLVKATRGAARYLAQQDLAELSSDELAAVRNKVISMAVCGREACVSANNTSTPALVPGLTADNVVLCDYMSCPTTHKNVATGLGTVDLVSVTIGGAGQAAFEFTSLVPWVIPDITYWPVRVTMPSRYF